MPSQIPDIAFTVEDLDALHIAGEKKATKELGEICIEVVEVVVSGLNTVNESRATVRKPLRRPDWNASEARAR